MRDGAVVERLWYGEDGVARTARALLAPAEAIYGAIARIRERSYDAGLAHARATAVPALAVGNLTVGGTGKTPIAAWFAVQLRDRGARPAIVLRGYGADEPLVHERLNPDVPVVVDPDRARGSHTARARGADVVVLDDAFQHRQVRRVADVVLVSADRWTSVPRLLPAGPFREPLDALRRAHLALVTRRASGMERAVRVRDALERRANRIGVGIVHLALRGLVRVRDGAHESLDAIGGERVRAISAIGDPAAFERQLAAAGAEVRAERFPDHHRFTNRDAQRLMDVLSPEERPVCTLKDAVKLAPLWPRAGPPLWYVSQQVLVEHGREAIDDVIARVLRARNADPHQP